MNVREFQVSDLVLRKNMGSMIGLIHIKLGANWEGPYMVTRTIGTGAYYLRDQVDINIPNPWNIFNLRTYYH